jgi:pilus assembly protein Flp/PilA
MLYLSNESGQGLVEYALILVLVAIVAIAVLAILGPQVANVFSQITYVLANPPAPGG